MDNQVCFRFKTCNETQSNREPLLCSHAWLMRVLLRFDKSLLCCFSSVQIFFSSDHGLPVSFCLKFFTPPPHIRKLQYFAHIFGARSPISIFAIYTDLGHWLDGILWQALYRGLGYFFSKYFAFYEKQITSFWAVWCRLLGIGITPRLFNTRNEHTAASRACAHEYVVLVHPQNSGIKMHCEGWPLPRP